MKGHDTSPEVARVEQYIYTRQRDGGKPTFQLDIGLLVILYLFVAPRDIRLVFHQEPSTYLTHISYVDLLDL